MVVTPSTMWELGSKAPWFELSDVVSGRLTSLDDFSNKRALLVMFICRHCPYVVHIKKELPRLGKDYANSGLGIVAISSNDIEQYPEDAPEKLKEMAEEHPLPFPFCYDETQEVAKAFKAACTPDFFLYNEERKLIYRGQFDDSRPSNGVPVTGKDLRSAIEAVLSGKPVDKHQKPSIGCNIKWKPGNAPKY